MRKPYTLESIERYRQAALRQFANGMPKSTIEKLRGPRPHTSKENNPNWGGDKVGYHGIHGWLKKEYGKASYCEANPCTQKSKRFEWALIKGKKYERNRENFKMLCVGCHKKYDMTEELRRKIGKSLIGNTNKSIYSRDYFVEQGRKGGNLTLKNKGTNHFKRISKKAVKARKHGKQRMA